jgi:hypothetical protein
MIDQVAQSAETRKKEHKQMHRNRIVALLGFVAVTGLAVGSAGWAHAAPATDVGDSMLPANSFVKLFSTSSQFSVPPTGGITVTCTVNIAYAKTPPIKATAPATQSLLVLPPTFDDGINPTTFAVKPCTDSPTGGTDVSTCTGAWTATATDLATETTEPNTDTVHITVPKGGCVVKSSLGCTITVAPTAPFVVPATFTDVDGKLHVHVTNLPIAITGGGCPPATTSSFTAVYTTTPRLHDN